VAIAEVLFMSPSVRPEGQQDHRIRITKRAASHTHLIRNRE